MEPIAVIPRNVTAIAIAANRLSMTRQCLVFLIQQTHSIMNETKYVI